MQLSSRIAIAAVLVLGAAAPLRGAEPSLRPPGPRPFGAALPGASSGPERLTVGPSSGLRSDPIRQPASNGLPAFVGAYLSPRLEARLAPLVLRLPTAESDRLHRDPGVWESLAQAAGADSRRAVESAARGYIIEKTGLDRVSITISRGPAGTPNTSPAGKAPALRLRLGFSGIVPRMDCSVPAGQGEFRLQVAARGDVTLRYDSGRSRGVSVGADLDPLRGQYGVSLLGRF